MSIRRPLKLLLVLAAVALGALLDGPAAQLRPIVPLGAANAAPNLDVRAAATDADRATLAQLVPPALASAGVAAAREGGLARLRATVAGLTTEAHPFLGTVEVLGTTPGATFLTPPSDDRVATLRAFLTANADVYGLASAASVAELIVAADYVNPAGNLAWVELEQSFNGIPGVPGRRAWSVHPAW